MRLRHASAKHIPRSTMYGFGCAPPDFHALRATHAAYQRRGRNSLSCSADECKAAVGTWIAHWATLSIVRLSHHARSRWEACEAALGPLPRVARALCWTAAHDGCCLASEYKHKTARAVSLPPRTRRTRLDYLHRSPYLLSSTR